MTTRSLIGVLVTAVVLFLVGFVFWGLNPLAYSSWNQVADDAQAQAALAELMPESGVYFVPFVRDPEALSLFESGPMIQAYVNHSPMAPGDISAFGFGFLVNLGTALLLALLLRPSESFASHMRTGLLLAGLIIVTVDINNLVWWQVPADWQFAMSFYTALVVLIGTAVTSYFVRPKA